MPTPTTAAHEGGLTAKEIQFVYHYLENGQNGAQAAISAGYSAKSAKETASRMIAQPRVKAAIDKQMGKTLRKLEISRERVLQEVAKLAFFDIRKCFNPDGTLKEITDLDDETAAALAGMDVIDLDDGSEAGKRAFLKKFKVSDKKGALELLGKHLKMWTDKVEVSDNRPKVVRRDMTGKGRKGSE